MENREERRARRRGILTRLNANEELSGTTRAKTDPDEEERRRRLHDEMEWEKIRRGGTAP